MGVVALYQGLFLWKMDGFMRKKDYNWLVWDADNYVTHDGSVLQKCYDNIVVDICVTVVVIECEANEQNIFTRASVT